MGIRLDKLRSLRNSFRNGAAWRRAALIAAVLLALLILARLLQDPIRQVVIEPLWYYLLYAGLVLESLNQWAIWLILLICGLLIGIGSLLQVQRSKPQEELVSAGSDHNIAQLSGWIELMEDSEYYRWRVARHLSELSIELLARQSNLGHEQLRKQIQAGRLDMPPEVSEFLQSGLSRGSHSQRTRPGIRRPATAAEDTSIHNLLAAVEFLEAELNYGHSSQHH